MSEKTFLNLIKVFSNFFMEKKKEKIVELTTEQRMFINKHFPQNNALETFRFGEYVSGYNANAEFGRGSLSFYSENGNLKAHVTYYRQETDKNKTPSVLPLDRFEVTDLSESGILKLKSKLWECGPKSWSLKRPFAEKKAQSSTPSIP